MGSAVEGLVGEAGPQVTGSGDGALWSGRFSTPPAPEAHALGRSLHVDIRLASQDVEASIAHVRALEDAGLLTVDETARLEDALVAIGHDIAEGRFIAEPADEDIHSAIERAVTARLGDLGARLHAGRSRNDLVVTDLRLWLLAAARRIDGEVVALVRALVARAREHAETVMPGTTHARAAQPVTLGHHLLAHAWALLRDLDRLREWAVRASTSGLGAGAIATSTLGLDPGMTAARLGMHRAFTNSIDAVSDRDFVMEFVADAAICAMHLSRTAADLARWTDEALGWAELDEAYSTGSSMMPQKQNPDVAELVRAKAGRLLGHFTALTSVMNGPPLGYHRDLQEDKEPVFDTADTLELSLGALAGCLETTTFDPGAMRASAAAEGLYATDLAEALVKAGVPFRRAHQRVGELLKRLEAEGRTPRDLTDGEWVVEGLSGGAALLDPDRAVRARAGVGGPSSGSVVAQSSAIANALEGRRR